jgi:mono/diheme cytochrome c family protein
MIRRIPTTLALFAALGLFACKKDEPANKPANQKAAVKKAASTRPASAPTVKVTEKKKNDGKPVPAANADAAAQGKAHYLRACAPCHGLDGSGGQMRNMLPKIGDLTSASTHARMRDPEIIRLIKKGRGKMPPMENSLDETHIVQIVAYIRTLQK